VRSNNCGTANAVTSRSCRFTYGAGPDAETIRLTGSYVPLQDGVHEPSSGSTDLQVVAEEETSTTLHCAVPAPVGLADPCTVEVTSKFNRSDVPAGRVTFSSSTAGQAFQPSSCELDFGQCTVAYVPGGVVPRTDTMIAAYQGSTAGFKASTGSTPVEIGPLFGTPEDTSTALRCPAAISLGSRAPCTVEVTGRSHQPVSHGQVILSSSSDGDGASGFQPPICELDAAGRCQVTYIAGGTVSRTDTLTAAYQGVVQVFGESTGTVMIGVKPGAAPNTVLKKKPPRKSTARAAKFTFLADQPGATFQCKLDKKPFKACGSPFTTQKLTSGRHVFKVRAVNAQGVADPTPAAFSWLVR
jgi:hypothetical protein